MMRSSISLLAAALALGCAAPTFAHPDLSGVWRIKGDQTALLTTDGKTPPLNPAALRAYQTTKAKRAAGDLSWDGVSTQCKPPGEPRILMEQMPFEIVQQKTNVFFAYQWNRLDRFVKLDQPLNVKFPTYFGTSVGNWQGDKLVVDATGFNDKFFLDRDGLPHSTDLKLREVFSLSPDGNTLHADITVTDPKYYTASWQAGLDFSRQDQRLREDICEIRTGIYKAAQ